MPVITYTSRCLYNRRIAEGVYEFMLTKPEGFTFKPGQFVLFDVAHPDNPEDIQTRAFSIASTPQEKDLLFVAKLIEGGRASRWIEKRLKEGSEVSLKGPFGNFLLKDTPDHRLLFIATSTGIAPFRSQILSALEAGDLRRMDLVYGVRSEKDLFWAEQLQAIAQRNENFFLHIALSGGSDGWTGHRGRVQTLLPLIVKDFSQLLLYACGSPAMTKDIKELATIQWGMDKKLVHVEGYI